MATDRSDDAVSDRSATSGPASFDTEAKARYLVAALRRAGELVDEKSKRADVVRALRALEAEQVRARRSHTREETGRTSTDLFKRRLLTVAAPDDDDECRERESAALKRDAPDYWRKLLDVLEAERRAGGGRGWTGPASYELDRLSPEVGEVAVFLVALALADLDTSDELRTLRYRTLCYRDPREAARRGFLQGLSDAAALDVFGDGDFLVLSDLHAYTSDALYADWERVANDFRQALVRLYDQVKEALAAVTKRQGELFDPDTLEAPVDRD